MLEKNDTPLRFLQIGDLHITDAGLQNHLDLRRIVDEVNDNTAGKIDFVYLPGDNADDGTPEQFWNVRNELSHLVAPWHAIPGDHDFKSRSLDAFYSVLGAQLLPQAISVAGCRCLFLDYVGAGTGGPDFKLGDKQLQWLKEERRHAVEEGEVRVADHSDDFAIFIGEE